MKKYLLFSFGQFNDKSVKTILNVVSRFSDNDKMLFQNGNEYLNVQFFSNDSLEDLRYNITKHLEGMTNCQFLFEDYDKNVKYVGNVLDITNKERSLTDDYKFNNEVKEDFDFIRKLDLVIKDFIDDNKTEVDDVEDFECGEDDDIYLSRTMKKIYSIDNILDKITENGLSSLTKEELNFLNNLSK